MSSIIQSIKGLFSPLFSWIGRAMGDGENPSASRFIAVPSLLIANVVPFLVWGYISYVKIEMIEFPGSVIGAISAINTALLIFVNAQKRLEK